MTPNVKIDTTEFHKALREYLLKTKRELSVALNSRMFFLMVRYFVLLPPMNPRQKRTEIRRYLNFRIADADRIDPKTGKRIGKRRLRHVFSRVHKIVQAKRGQAGEKGLYGEEMRKAAAAFRRRAIGSVGYLKSGVAKAIQKLNGTFIQMSRVATNKRKAVQANGALIRMQEFYGTDRSAVSRHRGNNAWVKPATPGLNPSSTVALNIGIADGQEARVNSIMVNTMRQAMNDELAEINRHLTQVAQEVANEHNAK
jgi:hypothetical protein